ncbi:MAG: SufS family cysteine desulfurase [Candidatus Levybacteria bacterium]|nr:SufS family cysteine desulfurase [Candidatus Levybacteria bacterium]
MNKNIKNDFPIFEKNRNLVYLDSAATSQKPKVVIDAIGEYYENYNANVRRGLYPIAEKATEKVEEVRRKVAKFINAKTAHEIIFVRNTTEAINLVAYSMLHNIKRGDSIVATIMEHHSNFVPWQQLCIQKGAKLEVIDFDKNFQFSILNFQSNLNFQKAKLLVITHISNVLGTINPIKDIIKKVKKINPEIKVLVDAAQSVPHLKVDVRDLDCDFLAFSGHKMMAGTGIGILYGKEKVLKKMSSFLFGGDMIQSVSLDKTIFADLPFKFEAGTPDIAGIISLGAAIDYLEKIGMNNIQKHEKEITSYALLQMKKIDGLTIYGPKNSKERSGVISFNITGIHPHDIAQILGDMGICIRAGMHCAMPLHTRLGVAATARASFYIYNEKEDVDKLIEGIKKVKKIFKK